MIVIGLTGGSGSGKSSAASFLCCYGGCVIDCDAIYADMTASYSECTLAIARAFGNDILYPDGALNRKKLGSIVFSAKDRSALDKLNGIVHPIVVSAVKKKIAAYAEAGVPYVIIDAPQLFESGANALCDYVVAVIAERDTRVARIVKRDNISEQSANARIDAQLSDSYFVSVCDFVITNNSTDDELKFECESLLQELGIA